MLPIIFAFMVTDAVLFTSTQVGTYDTIIAEAADDAGVSPWVLKGLLSNESELQPLGDGPTGAGMSQWTPSGVAGLNALRRAAVGETGHKIAPFTMADALVPDLAIRATAEWLGYAIARYRSVDAAIASYRCPEQANWVKRLGLALATKRGHLNRCGRLKMTSGYVRRVKQRIEALLEAARKAVDRRPALGEL